MAVWIYDCCLQDINCDENSMDGACCLPPAPPPGPPAPPAPPPGPPPPAPPAPPAPPPVPPPCGHHCQSHPAGCWSSTPCAPIEYAIDMFFSNISFTKGPNIKVIKKVFKKIR